MAAYKRTCAAIAMLGILAGISALLIVQAAPAGATDGLTPVSVRIVGTNEAGLSVVVYCATAEHTNSPYFCSVEQTHQTSPTTVTGTWTDWQRIGPRGGRWINPRPVVASLVADGTHPIRPLKLEE